MSDYASRSKEYQAQEEASRKRRAAEAKAGAAISKQKDAEYDAAQKGVQNRMKSYGGGRYQQPRRALGILSDAKRLLRI